MLAKKAGVLFLISLMVLFIGRPNAAGIEPDAEYTLDAQFDEGNLVDVNHDSPNNDQLQLNTTTLIPVVFVAASGRGTVVRINAEAGVETVEHAPARFALRNVP